MIKISISEIKEFLRRSRQLKGNSILPILGYIKLDVAGDGATLTKTTLQAWCMHQIAAEFETNATVLVDEKLLIALVNNSLSDHITIEASGKNVVLSDGRSKVSFSIQNDDHFPTFPERTEEKSFTLNVEVLSAIRSAIQLPNVTNNNSWSYCYMGPIAGKFDVFSTNSGHTMYRKTFEQELPEVAISVESGGIISQYDQVRYFRANNFDFYDCGKTLYGFVQSEFKTPDYMKAFSKINVEPFFELSRAEIVQFCDLTTSSTNDAAPEAMLHDNGIMGISLSYSNADAGVETKMDFSVEKNFTITPFCFNPKILVGLLKAIECKSVRFSPVNGLIYCIWSPEDEHLQTLLSGMAQK